MRNKLTIFVLYIVIVLFASCDLLNSVATDVVKYWAEITGTTEGTTATQFIFDVDTNDTNYVLYCDDVKLTLSRSKGYTFKSGKHTIKVITGNKATDTMIITVSEIVPPVVIPPVVIPPTIPEIEYTTRFIIHKTSYPDQAENVASLNYPILTFDGAEYDVSTMNVDVNGLPVIARLVDTERQIHLYMNITDGYDTFLFHSGNMEWRLYFNENELTIENMTFLLNYMNREEIEVEAVGVRFDLQITTGEEFYCDEIQNQEYYMALDGSIADNGIKTIIIPVTITVESDFITRSGNFLKFFSFSLDQMELVKLRIAVEILERYTADNLLDLVFEFDRDNSVLEEYGYYD